MKKKAVAVAAAVILAGVIVSVLIRSFGTRSVSFRLVYTGRTYGYLLPKEETKEGRWLGGFERRATAIKQAVGTPKSFVVDCGGFFAHWTHGSMPYREVLNSFVIEGMNRTGVEVAGVDAFDQIQGKEKTLEYTAIGRFPFVSASLVDAETDQYIFEPFKVIEKDGLRIAFVGVMDRELIDIKERFAAQAQRQLVPGEEYEERPDLPNQGEGLVVLTLAEALDRVAPLVKDKADVTVLLCAGGSNTWGALHKYGDGKTFQIVLDLAGKPVFEPSMQGKVPVLFNGIVGTTVGVADCEYLGPGEVTLKSWKIHELTDKVAGAPELAGLVPEMRAYCKDLDPVTLVDRIYEPDGEERYVGAEVCSACHSEEYEIWLGGPHSKALEPLKKQGAQYDPDCVVCHVSDYQAVDGYVSEQRTPLMAPINCEVCHGRASIHVKLEGHGIDARLRIPDPPRCVVCHDYINDPDFEYAKNWSKIMHGRGRRPAAEAGGASRQDETE